MSGTPQMKSSMASKRIVDRVEQCFQPFLLFASRLLLGSTFGSRTASGAL